MSSSLPSISEHRSLRFGVLFVLYLAQGVPYGLILIALPGWLVNEGVSAVELGVYVSAASLPWTLKFLHGFFMDRYAFLPMGRRRPWLIGAQLLMVLGLLAAAALNPPVADLSLLAALGFTVMLATTVQDVAVDGMAVDLLAEGERAKANGLMFGAQSVGIAAGGAVSGALISQNGGLTSAMLAVAGFVSLAIVLMALLRERPGERLLPWSPGRAAAESQALQVADWRALLKRTFRALLTGRSLAIIFGVILAGASWGYYLALAPLLSAEAAGWDTARYSAVSGLGALVSGIAAIAIFGLWVERVGTRIGLMAATGLMGGLFALMAVVPDQWARGEVMTGFILILNCLYVLLLVAFAALAMRICDRAVSATQFGLYVAGANLGASLAAAIFGPVMEAYSFFGVLSVAAAGMFLSCGVFAVVGASERSAVVGRPLVD